jgi:quaternary ammonium compound-resistance protein SugE
VSRAAAAWTLLIVAGLLEIGWSLGFKLSQTADRRLLGLATSALCMAASGTLLWLAQRDIPIGTAYAVWTGIGAAGTFLIGVLFFGDATSALRIASVALIIAGVIGLQLAHA